MSAEENPSIASEGLPQAQPDAGNDSTEAAEAGDMFAGMQEMSEVTEGKIVRGRVLNITDTEVLIDIGQKSEGAIPRAEFLAADGSLTIHPGDLVDVEIESYDENEGTFTVSHKKAARLKTWDNIEAAFNNQTIVRGRVVERTKGGLIVDMGARAFLPGSQADIRPLRNLDSLIGQEVCCKVIKLNKARNNLVVSRKAVLEDELNQKKSQLLHTLAEGAEVTGHVKNVTDYGAFIDLGGLDGLLHITDIAWGRVTHASEVIQVGQEIRVKVLKYDPEKGRVSLGLKQLAPDPWDGVAGKYEIGQSLTGRVVSVTDYGAFVEIEPGVEGLVHVSEMAWSRRMKHPSKIVSVGDTVEVRIIEVHGGKRRISLSLKQALPDPWTTIDQHYQPGQMVEGRVRNLTDFGAFVELEDGVDALIHVSDLSWSKSVKHPSEVLKKGQKVQGQILSLDPAKRRISLGLKQLKPDVWDGFFSKAQIGMPVQGKVVRIAQFGAFVEVEEGIEALCHNSELDSEHAAAGSAPLEMGREYEFWVVRLDPEEKRIGLSMKTGAKPSSGHAGSAAMPEKPGAPPDRTATTTANAPEPPVTQRVAGAEQ
ncbi:MAG: 30S ribosomal protein S1 [Terriglobia bacterium]